MIRTMPIWAVAAVAVATLGAGPAQAMDGQAFNVNFYNDAAHTNMVGFAKAECNPEPVAVMRWGTSTQYQEVVYVGECINGELHYY